MKFRITDNVSGKTLVISGDKAPTDQEAEQLFQQSGVRDTQVPDLTQGQSQQNPLQRFTGAMAPISNFLMPNVVSGAQENLQKIGAGNLTPTAPTSLGQGAQMFGASALGPLGETLFGTDKQKTQQAGNREMASTLLGALGLAGGASAAVQSATNIGKGITATKSVSPIKILSYLRDQAAGKAGKITTEGLIKAGDNYVQMNPLAQDVWDTFKPTISKEMSAKQLLDRMTGVFGQAYSRSGAVKDTAQAELMNRLYGAGKVAMKTQAPEVAKYTTGMRQILTAPKTIQSLAWLLAKLGLARGAF